MESESMPRQISVVFPLSFFPAFFLSSFLSSPQSTTHHDVPSEGAKVLCPQREASEPACENGNRRGCVTYKCSVNCACHRKFWIIIRAECNVE